MTDSARPIKVRIVENGRDGDVLYEEGGRTLSFYWAFGAGDVVTSISVGDVAEWRRDHPWAADRRDEIIARVAAETIRQRAPTCRAEIDETGRFLLLKAPPGGAAPNPLDEKRAKSADFFWRLNKLKGQMAIMVLILTLVAGGLLVAGRATLTIKTTGTPIGASARTGDFIATPISRLEPYVPSLDRNHARDRYSIGMLIHSARDAAHRRHVKIAEGQTGSDIAKTRISGVSGDLVWIDGPDSVVIDAGAARVLTAEEAQRAPAPPRPVGAEALAALATAERRLEGLLAAPGEDGAPVSPDADDIHSPAFLRAESYGEALLLDGGDFLRIHNTRPYREGYVVASRVTAAGEIVWRIETELGRVEEALPDPAYPALVGARPRQEGKVPEPLLVIIDAATGTATTHSLLVQ